MNDDDDEQDDEEGGSNQDSLLMPCLTAYPKVKIGMVDVDVRTLLFIQPGDLISDYQTIHHWIVTFAHKVSTMGLAVAAQKRVVVRLEARLYRSYRSSSTEKKPTEGAIKNMIILDESLQKEQDRLDAMEAERSRYINTLNAVENKRDMIVNMGAELRNRRRKDISM